jgi:predicted amidohydrolase YtcJ
MTIWAAYASFDEARLGTLEKGKEATLSVFVNKVSAGSEYQPNFAAYTFIKGKKVYSVE